MAYGRYRSYRRRYRRRRYPRKSTGGTDYIKMAKMAYTGVKYLKSLVNVEKHPHEATFTHSPDNSTGVGSCLNLIAQGDTNDARTGNSIMLKSININLRFTMNASATHTQIRCMLFIDKEAGGLTPTITEFLQAANVLANYNHDEATRFQMLADFNVTLSITGTQEVYKRIYRRLYCHERFDATTAAVTSIVDNAIWLFTFSDEPTNLPTVAGRSQLLFIDN